jgi:hypothetical protein
LDDELVGSIDLTGLLEMQKSQIRVGPHFVALSPHLSTIIVALALVHV